MESKYTGLIADISIMYQMWNIVDELTMTVRFMEDTTCQHIAGRSPCVCHQEIPKILMSKPCFKWLTYAGPYAQYRCFDTKCDSYIRYLGLCTVKGLQSYITSLVIVRRYHGKQVIVYKVSDVLEEVRSLEDFTKDTHKSQLELDSTLTDYKITGIEK